VGVTYHDHHATIFVAPEAAGARFLLDGVT